MSILNEAISDADYAALDWPSLIIDRDERHFRWALASKFFARARDLDDAGQTNLAQALRSLGGAISMHMRHSSQPVFGPMMQDSDKRTASAEDLGEHDVALLARAARDAQDPWLRARFADLAVTTDERTPPDWQLGQVAVEAYLDYAESVLDTDWAIDAVDELRRGLVLLRVYAKRDESLWNRYWAVVFQAVHLAIEKEWPGMAFPFGDEAIDRSKEACEVIAPLFEAKAAELDTTSPQRAAEWHEQAHRLRRRLNHTSQANAALMAQGESMNRAAEWSAEHQPILAPMQLSEAIQILRRARAAPSRVKELRDRLAQLERASLDHYGHFEHKLDVSDSVRWIEQQIAAPDFFSALLRCAYRAGQLLNIEDLERRVRDSASQHPISHLFPSTRANSDGTIVSQQRPFDGNDPESVRQHMVRSAAEYDLSLRANVMVSRACDLLYTNYQPTFGLIKQIVGASPITPRDQVETFARGLFAGFIDDWMAASAYLIPAMERFVRTHLKRNDAHTTALNDDGTQREKMLGELLEMPEAEKFFGKNLVFELQVHLIEQEGFNLRNAYCHGLMADDEMRNQATISLWWVVWRMILFPWHDHPAVSAEPKGQNGPEEQQTSTKD